MKEYKYTINGNKYEVEIGDIVDNITSVKVNGEDYKVEMEPEAEPEKKKVVLGKPAAAASEGTATATTDAANVNTNTAAKAPLPGTITAINVKRNDLTHNIARGRAFGYEKLIKKHSKALEMIEAAQQS